VWHIQHEKVLRMETAQPFPPLLIAVVDDNPADVYIIARVLHAHGLQYILQVLESRESSAYACASDRRPGCVHNVLARAYKSA
jgi:CheY-like chemotaxis protein